MCMCWRSSRVTLWVQGFIFTLCGDVGVLVFLSRDTLGSGVFLDVAR
jgi:hypothetical protein